MRTLSEMITWIGSEVRNVIPDFPVDVQPSPDDTYVLCVRVYAVPRAKVKRVEKTVFELEERLLTKTRYILLPMVKNLEVTRQYYPENCPPLPRVLPPANIGARLADQRFRKRASTSSLAQ